MKNRNYIKYGLIFLFFLFWNTIISPLNLDEIWNYGFTRNIYLGMIPYKDFNMVVTPFFPMLLSLSMHILGDNILIFHIENSVLLTILVIIMDKLLGKNSTYIYPFLLWPLNITYPSYNMFACLLAVLILYLEDKEEDTKIGILLGLLFLTKQSIGLLFIGLQFLFKKRNRIKISLIPITIFIIYLLLTNSIYPFIDQCFLGLLDFNNSNGNYFNIVFFLTIIFIILNILFIKKERNNSYYYLLAFTSIVFPIFDYYHFIIYFCFFLIVFIKNHMYSLIPYNKIALLFLSAVVIIPIISFSYQDTYPNDITHFEYRYITNTYQKATREVNTLIKKYNKVMIIGPNAYYHRMINNEKIENIDLINTGNWGYNGSEKLLEKIKKKQKEYIFFIDKNEKGNNKQTDQEIIKYIENNAKRIENTKYYEIYQFE